MRRRAGRRAWIPSRRSAPTERRKPTPGVLALSPRRSVGRSHPHLRPAPMSPNDPLFLWLPLLAVAAHLIEEFVWPGGFARWYRWYRPERAASVTTRFIV